MIRPSHLKCCLSIRTRRRIFRVLFALWKAKWLWSWRFLAAGLVFTPRKRSGDLVVWVCFPFLAIEVDIPSEDLFLRLLDAMS